MGRTSSFLLGIVAGVAVSLAFDYLFGPARETAYDRTYQSRLDWALSQGRLAADQHEEKLRREFQEAKKRRPTPPPADGTDSLNVEQ
jgi:hypothetical protein